MEWIFHILEVSGIAYLVYRAFPRFNKPVGGSEVPEKDTVELLHRFSKGQDWHLHSFRPVGHKDIVEALQTPGMAIRRNGRIEEGVQ